MNHVTHRKRLLDLQQIYKEFVPHCPAPDVSKICLEIHRISKQVEFIQNLNLSELQEEVFIYPVELESKLNFINN